ncbi:MAG: hypothetical protein ABIQ35_01455 [Verrucomicrobiota bacterium]
MINRDSLKQEIDRLPEDSLSQLERFLRSLARPLRERKPLSGYKLGGYFDKVSIRDQAYE